MWSHGFDSNLNDEEKAMMKLIRGRRDLSRKQTRSRLANGDCTDLTFQHLSLEMACVEIGLVDHGEHGGQRNYKKLDNSMRSFCKHMVEQGEITADSMWFRSLNTSPQQGNYCQFYG